jgi:hypothetical protein
LKGNGVGMSKYLFRIVVILITLIGIPFTAKTQKLSTSSLAVFTESHVWQDNKTHFINVKITVVNSDKTRFFFGDYGYCSITYTIQRNHKEIARFPGKSTRSGTPYACPAILLKLNVAPNKRKIILDSQLYNRYFEVLRLKPGRYQFNGLLRMRGRIGTQKVSKFPLGPVAFTVK